MTLSGLNLSMLLLLTKATIILVAALGITVAMQRASAGARHLVWLVTLGALMLIPAVAAWTPLRLGVLPAVVSPAEVPSALISPVATGSADRTALLPGVSVAPEQSPPATPNAAIDANSVMARFDGLSALSMLVALWAAVVLCIAATLAYASISVHRIVRHARPLDSKDWLTPLWEVSDRLGLDEPPRLLRSDQAKMPFACGVMHPTIVLPASCDEWTADRRHAVLLHELAHVRRHDLAGHTLGRLACAVYWFHPLVWTAAKRLRAESERACDDLALACGARAADYAEHLLDIVTSVRRDTTPWVALSMARRNEFEGRMLAILDPELHRSSPTRWQSASLIGSLAVVAILVSAAAPAPRASAKVVRVVSSGPTAAVVTEKARVWDAPPANQPDDSKSEIADAKDAGFDVETKIESRTETDTRTQVATSTSQSVALAVSGALSGVARVASKEALAALNGVLDGMEQRKTSGAPDDRALLLAKVLRSDTSENLRRVAAWGLSEYADTQIGAEALAQALRRDASAAVREMAAWALADGEEGQQMTVEALTAALRGDANVKVRATAAWALGNIGDHGSVDALAAALSDASVEVRQRSIWALGQVEPKQAPRPLLAMLNDADPRNRELAAWALFHIEDPGSVPALEAALARETNKDLQLDYIRALASVGEKSVDALRKLLESNDPKVRSMAVRALAGGNAAGPWPWPWPQPRPYP